MHNETVFIVDDDASVRDALSLLLSLNGYATSTFSCAEDFLGAIKPDWCGCVVADIRMPGLSGLELQKRLKASRPGLPVIMITAHGDVNAARDAFLSDAVDFIEKPFDGDQLVAAVKKALERVSGQVSRISGDSEAVRRLSAREHEVMGLMVRGLHNRRIAQELGISPRTVEVHKARVLAKLGVRNVIDLVRLVDHKTV